MDWEKTLVNMSENIKTAIESLNNSSLRICMVVGTYNTLIGTVSDGDIRRGILKGYKLNSNIKKITRKNPIVCSPTTSLEDVKSLMQENGISQIPIVDEHNIVCGMHDLSNLDQNKLIVESKLMVIMAGGKGRRLMPMTENCPKPMLLINGKPMLEWIIHRAKEQGFDRFIICVNYLAHLITGHFGDGGKYGVKISYVNEDKPLGTGGALSLVKNKIKEPFILTNGDVLSDVNYSSLLDFHIKNNADATMCVRKHELHNPFGVVKTDGVKIKGFEEKPIHHSLINAGIYAFSPEILSHLDYNEYYDVPTIFIKISKLGKTGLAYLVHEHWIDVGRPEDLISVNGYK